VVLLHKELRLQIRLFKMRVHSGHRQQTWA
jgi:hypothetical protein